MQGKLKVPYELNEPVMQKFLFCLSRLSRLLNLDFLVVGYFLKLSNVSYNRLSLLFILDDSFLEQEHISHFLHRQSSIPKISFLKVH